MRKIAVLKTLVGLSMVLSLEIARAGEAGRRSFSFEESIDQCPAPRKIETEHLNGPSS